MEQRETVELFQRRLNGVVSDLSTYGGNFNRTCVDFHYRFSTPREFRSSIIVGESGSVVRFELRFPAVRRENSSDVVEKPPKTYKKREIENIMSEVVEKIGMPKSTKVEINEDVDSITLQPHLVCDNPSLLPSKLVKPIRNLPDAYLSRVPEHHHVFDNTV